MQNFFKEIRYLAEVAIVKLGIWFFEILGPQRASNIGSWLARVIGKKHSTNKLAMTNLGKVFPKFSLQEKEKIVDDMWDNLGRVVGEYSHIAKVDSKKLVEKYVRVSEEDKQNIDFIKKNFKGGIIFSAHIGNWEIGPKTLNNFGLNVGVVYRPLNNKYVEKITAEMRGVRLIPKGSQGSRQIIDAIRKGEYVIILMDQKISEGEPVRFFHEDAITATSVARIALKYNVPLIPARSIRIDHQFKFMVKVEKPLEFQRSGDLNADILKLTLSINQKLEKWITEYPAQWFWVHNRWKK